MVRKLTDLVLMIGMLVLLVIPASAAEGSIRVKTDIAQVVVRQVGTQEGNGFRLFESYGGGYLIFDDILSAELATWLARKDGSELVGNAETGSILFSGLEEGLYLVDCGETAPFLVSIPWDGYFWELDVSPEEGIPQTGDGIGSTIFALAASVAGLTHLGRRRKNY